jgi:predicted nucleotidyltransferase
MRDDQALGKAREFITCVEKIFYNNDLAILFGTYSRGFNERSGIDILIMVSNGLPGKPVERIDIAMPCILAIKLR